MAQISIIVPVFNAEKYLQRCLDSIKKQTFQDFECIIIDDGSSDNSYSICKEYSNSDNRFITISVPNGGVAKARNIGLEHVNSPWITFVDADDFVYPEYLDNFLKYNKDDIYTQVIQGYDCLGFEGKDIDTLYPSSHYVYMVVTKQSGADYIESNNLLYNWGIWCKVFSKEIIDKYGLKFKEKMKRGSDGIFWHMYLKYIDRFIYVPEVGYTYFCPKNFISLSRSRKITIEKEELFPIVEEYSELSRLLPEKFKLLRKSTKLLQNLYINNYFKLLVKFKLNSKEINELKNHKPKFKEISFSKRGLIFKCINFFPVKIIKGLLS